MFFQDIIQNLNNFWSKEGCLIMQPYDTEKGAGTMNPHTFLRAIGPEPWSVAYSELGIFYIRRERYFSVFIKKVIH